MRDWFDNDSRHPGKGPFAEIGTRPFVANLEDAEGELLTVIGEVDYKTNELGTEIINIRYWPRLTELDESVHDYCRSLF